MILTINPNPCIGAAIMLNFMIGLVGGLVIGLIVGLGVAALVLL